MAHQEEECRKKEAAYNFKFDSGLPPRSADLVTAGDRWLVQRTGGDTTPEKDRARRAGVEPRVQALEVFNLKYWKDAIRALYAVTYGTIGHKVNRLIELCFNAKSMGEAARAIAAFKVAEPAGLSSLIHK